MMIIIVIVTVVIVNVILINAPLSAAWAHAGDLKTAFTIPTMARDKHARRRR